MFKNNTTKEIKCNLNKTITLLTVKETYDVKDCSPILKNLHNRPPKVKRLTNLFEKTTGEFNNVINEINHNLKSF